MNNTVVGIHPVHRKLAQLFEMNKDRSGNTFIGAAELQALLPLLRQNYELIRSLDELKQLSFIAYEMGDHAWLAKISEEIEELEKAIEI